MNFDTKCLEITSKNPNMLVPWYLMAAWAYYKDDNPILSDAVFDELAKTMHKKWEEIEHFHKHLITRMDLIAGNYLGEYPSRIEGAVQELRKTR